MNYIIKDRESKLYLGAAGYRPSVELGPYSEMVGNSDWILLEFTSRIGCMI